jgi:hypothetical protein
MTVLMKTSARGRSSSTKLRDVATFARCSGIVTRRAVSYFQQRGLHRAEAIEEFRIGYAVAVGCAAWPTTLGYPLVRFEQAGLVNADGHDTFSHRIVFPLEYNLYGRRIGDEPPHRFPPAAGRTLWLGEGQPMPGFHNWYWRQSTTWLWAATPAAGAVAGEDAQTPD